MILLPTKVRTEVLLTGVLLLAFLPGCRKGGSAGRNGTNSGSAETRVTPAQSLEGEITGTNWHIPWTVRNDEGKAVPALVADAREGRMRSFEDSYVMQLNGVRAKLFQDGVHAADIEAGQIDANSDDHLLVGTGGVRVVSLTDPPDTVVTADKIVWDPHSHLMTALGHARVAQRPKDGGTPITQTGAKIKFDMVLKKIEVE